MDKFSFVITGIFVLMLLSLFLGFITMFLWNWLIVSIFGLRSIDIAEAIGLYVLAQLLFTRVSTSTKEK